MHSFAKYWDFTLPSVLYAWHALAFLAVHGALRLQWACLANAVFTTYTAYAARFLSALEMHQHLMQYMNTIGKLQLLTFAAFSVDSDALCDFCWCCWCCCCCCCRHGPTMEAFVCTSVVQLLCRTVKLAWFDSDAPRAIVDECKALMERGSPGHYLLALKILNMLVSEVNTATPGRTLTAVSYLSLLPGA
jgi:hypothetical protein